MGWTTQTGHWTSADGLHNWTRLETVSPKGNFWSMMPVYDEKDPSGGRWKIFYCDTEGGSGKPRVLVAATSGRGAIRAANNWTDAGYNLTAWPYSPSQRSAQSAGNHTVSPRRDTAAAWICKLIVIPLIPLISTISTIYFLLLQATA